MEPSRVDLNIREGIADVDWESDETYSHLDSLPLFIRLSCPFQPPPLPIVVGPAPPSIRISISDGLRLGRESDNDVDRLSSSIIEEYVEHVDDMGMELGSNTLRRGVVAAGDRNDIAQEGASMINEPCAKWTGSAVLVCCFAQPLSTTPPRCSNAIRSIQSALEKRRYHCKIFLSYEEFLSSAQTATASGGSSISSCKYDIGFLFCSTLSELKSHAGQFRSKVGRDCYKIGYYTIQDDNRSLVRDRGKDGKTNAEALLMETFWTVKECRFNMMWGQARVSVRERTTTCASWLVTPECGFFPCEVNLHLAAEGQGGEMEEVGGEEYANENGDARVNQLVEFILRRQRVHWFATR